LIATLAQRLRQAGCASLMLWTLAENPARAIYERLGGQLIGQKINAARRGRRSGIRGRLQLAEDR
jgi:hypothetical protein